MLLPFIWCGKWDLNPYVKDTRPSNVPVCLFQHYRISECKSYYIKTFRQCQGLFLNFFEYLFFLSPRLIKKRKKAVFCKKE